VLVVLESSHIICLDLDKGESKWTRHADPPSINREPAQVVPAMGGLSVLYDNWRMEQLDPSNGPIRNEFSLDTQPINLAAAACDGKRLFFVSRGALRAFDLSDGRWQWQAALEGEPAGPWRVAFAGANLIASPCACSRPIRWAMVYGAHLDTFPFLTPFALPVPFDFREQSFPVVIVDRASGKVVQRLDFTAGNGTGQVHVTGVRIVVTVGNQAWGLLPVGQE
jgi:hypothetical protein